MKLDCARLAFSFNYSMFEKIRHTPRVRDAIPVFITLRNLIHTMQYAFHPVTSEREVFGIATWDPFYYPEL